MTDDTTDEPRADDAEERTTDDADAQANDDDEDEMSATATHEYVWRCRDCKAQYDERPEECERCGGTSFRSYREL
jgi:hypothetical protein